MGLLREPFFFGFSESKAKGMSMKQLLNYNALAKVAHYWHDTGDGGAVIERVADETQVIEDNKALRNMTSSLDRWGDGQIVLRGVPMPLVDDWRSRGWLEKDQFWRCLKDERAEPYKVFGK